MSWALLGCEFYIKRVPHWLFLLGALVDWSFLAILWGYA